MPFARPTFREILTRHRTDLEDWLGKYPIPDSPEDLLARIVADFSHGLHGDLAARLATVLVDRCSDEELVRWARILGVPPRPGGKASVAASFASPADDTIPAGTIAKAGAVAYVVTSSSATAGTCTAQLEAVDTGTDANLASGTEVALTSPVAGVASTGTLDADAEGGTTADTVEELRARVLYRYAHPRRGGADGDFVGWALEVPGVAKAWEYPERTSARVVDLLFVREVEGEPYGWTIPTSGQVAEVQAYVDARAPSTFTVDVIAPTDDPQPITLSALDPNTAAVQAAVEVELRRMFWELAEPAATIAHSQIRAYVSEAAGEADHTVSVPSGSLVSTGDELMSYDGVTFP